MMSIAMRLGVAALAFSLASSLTAVQQAAAQTSANDQPLGSKFLDLCRSPSQASRVICGGVIVSMIDAHLIIGEKYPDLRRFCPVRRLNAEQARQMFVNWAGARDDIEAMDFPAIVITALRERYPCQQLPSQFPVKKSNTFDLPSVSADLK